MTAQAQDSYTPTLPAIGKSRWKQMQHLIPVCRETWRQLSLSGRAPQPVRLSARCTMYDNREVHRWLADPVNYQAVTEGAA